MNLKAALNQTEQPEMVAEQAEQQLALAVEADLSFP